MSDEKWPKLQHRIIAARRHAAQNSPTMTGKIDPNVIFVIDPHAAKRVLSEHELNDPLCNVNSPKEAQESLLVEPYLNSCHHDSSNPNYGNLLKPTKPTVLLNKALTNSNEYTWYRQRHCVSRAFAVGKELKHVCGQFAAEKMMELLQPLEGEIQQLPQQQQRRRRRKGFLSCQGKKCEFSRVLGCCWDIPSGSGQATQGFDIRLLAREVAIYAVLRMVLGDDDQEKTGDRNDVVDALRNIIGENLKPRRDEEFSLESKNCVELLDRLVRGILDKLSSKMAHGNDTEEDDDEDNSDQCDEEHQYSCIAERLLAYEKKQDKYLTRDEIVSNVHSALLAGVQTISTTIVGSLAHLADNPTYQNDLKSGLISGRDVVMETLRIFPPVAGLPRYSKSTAIEICTEEKKPCCRIEKRQMMVIDLLALAHAHFTCDETKGENKECVFSSLHFKPCKKNRKFHEQPWGIGKRKCPAGVVSVECISSLLERILRNEYLTWYFASSKDYSCLDHDQVGGWMESISYQPTLCFNSPIIVVFERHDS